MVRTAPVRVAALHQDSCVWTTASIIDVGGGESTLVDDLIDTGYSNLTVLDISETALVVTRQRLGRFAKYVAWRTQDILDKPLPKACYDVWHDRAVFHFLTEASERRRYIEQALWALKPGGFAIVGTFGHEGPEQCSGLSVARYDADELHQTFGAPFELVANSTELHKTPSGKEQQFIYCFCKRVA